MTKCCIHFQCCLCKYVWIYYTIYCAFWDATSNITLVLSSCPYVFPDHFLEDHDHDSHHHLKIPKNPHSLNSFMCNPCCGKWKMWTLYKWYWSFYWYSRHPVCRVQSSEYTLLHPLAISAGNCSVSVCPCSPNQCHIGTNGTLCSVL